MNRGVGYLLGVIFRKDCPLKCSCISSLGKLIDLVVKVVIMAQIMVAYSKSVCAHPIVHQLRTQRFSTQSQHTNNSFREKN